MKKNGLASNMAFGEYQALKICVRIFLNFELDSFVLILKHFDPSTKKSRMAHDDFVP